MKAAAIEIAEALSALKIGEEKLKTIVIMKSQGNLKNPVWAVLAELFDSPTAAERVGAVDITVKFDFSFPSIDLSYH